MSFKRSLEEIQKRRERSETADFAGAEMVSAIWLTKPDIVERVLPPPLKPAKIPLAHAFVSNYPETNFGLPYLESALFVRCDLNGIEGNYCLAMHLDGPGKGLAMAGGRAPIDALLDERRLRARSALVRLLGGRGAEGVHQAPGRGRRHRADAR